MTWASAGSPTPSKQLQRAADSAAEQRPHLLWPGCLQELLNLVALHSVFLHRKMAQAALQPLHRERKEHNQHWHGCYEPDGHDAVDDAASLGRCARGGRVSKRVGAGRAAQPVRPGWTTGMGATSVG
jgi:hypothetical protein